MQELLRKSAMEQSKAIKNKEVSAVELTQATLDRINAIDEKLGSFNSLTVITYSPYLIRINNSTHIEPQPNVL